MDRNGFRPECNRRSPAGNPAPVDSRIRTSAADARVACVLALDPSLPVLLRPDGAIQVGWGPRRAVLRPPEGLTASSLLSVLRSLPMSTAAAVQLAVRLGLRDGSDLESMLTELAALGVLQHKPGKPPQRLRARDDGRQGCVAIRIVENGYRPMNAGCISFRGSSGLALWGFNIV